MAEQNSGYGQATPNDSADEMAAAAFIVKQMIAKLGTAKLVQVKAVNGGGLEPGGTVDVLPLVQQIDGNGYGTPHGVVHGLPWSRQQGGKNAVICDPMVGDVGYVVVQDRDISTVKKQDPGAATTTGYLPATWRRFDISDGIYAGGCLNVAPDQYLIFTADGIRLVDRNGNSVEMDKTGVKIVDLSGNKFTTNSSGVNITDVNANQIVMAAGFVNIITPVLQVNGVPVTVP